MHSLTDFSRYQQQIKLDEIGEAGQRKLQHARVLCIGAGALASPLLSYLVAAGVGTVGMVDDDVVELGNLHRQILFRENQLAQLKVTAAKNTLALLNSSIQLISIAERFTQLNAVSLLSDYDIIADCTDNFTSRYLINDACFLVKKPFVTASLLGFSGQCSLFTGIETPCLRCLYPTIPAPAEMPDCNASGVLGVLPGVLGTLQAGEILKWLVNMGTSLAGRLITIDYLTLRFREFSVTPDKTCRICQPNSIITLSTEPTSCRSHNSMHHLISPQNVNDLLQANTDMQLIDVRTNEKHHAFNIGGVSIPTQELSNYLHTLDPTKLTITYCTSGGNSMRALNYLTSVGFTNVKSLDGGMTRWRAEIFK